MRLALVDGKFGAAQTAFEAALDAAPMQATAVMARLGMAEVAHAQGKPELMAELARAAKAQALELQGGKPQSFPTALASATLVRALHARGDADAAHQEAVEAVERMSASVDAMHPALVAARRLVWMPHRTVQGQSREQAAMSCFTARPPYGPVKASSFRPLRHRP